MTGFDRFVMVDWSGGNDTGPTPRKDAIWIAADGENPRYLRNRGLAEQELAQRISAALEADQRLLIGFDFPFAYPAGMAKALCGKSDPLSLWSWFEARVEDAPRANNRFDLAGQINLTYGGQGPFWGNGLARDVPGLPRTKAGYQNPFPERRTCEDLAKGTFTCWQLAGAGSVGSQMLMGLPVLERLRRRFEGEVAVWPFEPLDRPIAFVEIWPSLIDSVVKATEGGIRDAHQVRLMARALARLPASDLTAMLTVQAPDEGWIFGLGYEDRLIAAAAPDPTPPPLRNDCFALPPGVEWTPVDTALDALRARLSPVVRRETVAVTGATGRVLAHDVMAQRAHPPEANSAVDGFGFAAGSTGEGPQVLPLVPGRAAAGVPLGRPVPAGHAVRVLTGAALPEGVDTVVLDEDCVQSGGQVAFRGPVKTGANAREAGEDVQTRDVVLAKGRRLTPADLALASATGVADFEVFARLRVAVLSTGDELRDPGEAVGAGQIFDANRPMLLGMMARMGFDTRDLGRVPDDRVALRARLDRAAQEADVILTSGGASAGDEDHVSALLRETGSLQDWRIALKPGRPLALGMWHGTPVFGLPGNPVAAFVCTLIFARPALAMLAGAAWAAPQGFEVPAGFAKRKKPGRREFLRARLRDGQAEVFVSEGSGRISGLSWADGLVELPDAALEIREGDPVRYIPFASFGL